MTSTMTETGTTEDVARIDERKLRSGSADGGASESGPGRTTIADAVVAKVAFLATREVAGVHELGGGTSRALGAVGEKVGMSDNRQRGVSVEAGEREAAIDLTLVIDYGESIPSIARQVRENVGRRVEGITGLRVVEINITVNDLYFDGEDDASRVS